MELYAEFDYPKLLEFLRASHYISLEKAYKICEQRDLVPEMVFILGRMGNNKKALMLIIERLEDVQRVRCCCYANTEESFLFICCLH